LPQGAFGFFALVTSKSQAPFLFSLSIENSEDNAEQTLKLTYGENPTGYLGENNPYLTLCASINRKSP